MAERLRVVRQISIYLKIEEREDRCGNCTGKVYKEIKKKIGAKNAQAGWGVWWRRIEREMEKATERELHTLWKWIKSLG